VLLLTALHCRAAAPGTGGFWLAAGCASISRWNAKIRPTHHARSGRLGADVGARRTPLQARRLPVSSHMGPYTHYPPRTAGRGLYRARRLHASPALLTPALHMHPESERRQCGESQTARRGSAFHCRGTVEAKAEELMNGGRPCREEASRAIGRAARSRRGSRARRSRCWSRYSVDSPRSHASRSKTNSTCGGASPAIANGLLPQRQVERLVKRRDIPHEEMR